MRYRLIKVSYVEGGTKQYCFNYMNWWLVNKYPTKASFRKEEFVVRIEIFIMVKVHIVAQWVLTFVFVGLKLTQYRCDFQRFTYLGTVVLGECFSTYESIIVPSSSG
jgi:hypothetical protein